MCLPVASAFCLLALSRMKIPGGSHSQFFLSQRACPRASRPDAGVRPHNARDTPLSRAGGGRPRRRGRAGDRRGRGPRPESGITSDEGALRRREFQKEK